MIFLVIAYLSLFFIGYRFFWLSNSYDELRLVLIVLTFITGGLSLFILKSKFISKKNLTFLAFLIVILIISLDSEVTVYKFYDLLMWLSSFLLFYALKQENFLLNKNEFALCVVVLFSVIPCLYILFTLLGLIKTGIFFGWQMNSGSIRIYDSVIVPIFWIAVYLYEKNVYIKKAYTIICFFIALALFVDGARSALLSLFIPLIILYFSGNNYKKIVIKSFVGFLVAFILYQCVFYYYSLIYHQETALSIARYTSSYRSDIWLYMFELWKQNPFWGVGGGYLAQVQYPYGHHMHNAYLRLIFEWGFIGLVGLIWILNKMYSLMKSNVNIALKMGVLAILIDAMFSGNFIYPASQVACALFLALAFSQQDQMKFENNEFQNTTQQYLNTKTLYIACYLFFVVIVFVYLRYDMLCFGCSSDEGRAAPFFWEHGASQMLSKRDE
ncbi:MAG: O-antigen ligase family protein [Candidatus Acinetobacter avistercoris]|nr:O-antigen ligase family protein [Candidatus Acinetobacter avistercoris]